MLWISILYDLTYKNGRNLSHAEPDWNVSVIARVPLPSHCLHFVEAAPVPKASRCSQDRKRRSLLRGRTCPWFGNPPRIPEHRAPKTRQLAEFSFVAQEILSFLCACFVSSAIPIGTMLGVRAMAAMVWAQPPISNWQCVKTLYPWWTSK